MSAKGGPAWHCDNNNLRDLRTKYVSMKRRIVCKASAASAARGANRRVHACRQLARARLKLSIFPDTLFWLPFSSFGCHPYPYKKSALAE
jgi:hypothetical protein